MASPENRGKEIMRTARLSIVKELGSLSDDEFIRPLDWADIEITIPRSVFDVPRPRVNSRKLRGDLVSDPYEPKDFIRTQGIKYIRPLTHGVLAEL
jgi:hypothetical protein